ncbi:hypothetical protein LCGC14_2447590, partial [marine sediment metagenome]
MPNKRISLGRGTGKIVTRVRDVTIFYLA